MNDEDFDNFDELINVIFDVLGVSPTDDEKNKMSITLVADDSGLDEYQMSIKYGNNFIIIEGGSNDVEKQISQLIRGADSGNDAATETYTYSELSNLYSTNPDWKKAIDDAIDKNEDAKWTTEQSTPTNLEQGTGTINDVNDIDAINMEAKKITEKYGLDNPSLTKDGWSYSCSWNVDDSGEQIRYSFVMNISATVGTQSDYTYFVSTYGTGGIETGETKTSTAYELRNTISKWYKALRTIALVGLLSVLVYVGIRIIISSTGQEKAKYKKMITDWLAAICILFVLHYIMAFTMVMVENILEIFTSDAIIGTNGEDVLMSSIRQGVNTEGALSTSFTELLMYIVLVIYTVIFTIHYLKRLVYLAFFTMIAPLIALTYPLDKIKDRTSTSIWNVDKRICI